MATPIRICAGMVNVVEGELASKEKRRDCWILFLFVREETL